MGFSFLYNVQTFGLSAESPPGSGLGFTACVADMFILSGLGPCVPMHVKVKFAGCVGCLSFVRQGLLSSASVSVQGSRQSKTRKENSERVQPFFRGGVCPLVLIPNPKFCPRKKHVYADESFCVYATKAVPQQLGNRGFRKPGGN